MKALNPVQFLFAVAIAVLAFVPKGSAQAVIRPGDVFEMRLTGMPVEYAQEFSGQYTVAENGFVSVPYIGEIKAGGATPPQVAQTIDTKLVAAGLFAHPTAIVAMQPQVRQVTIGGGVRQPQAVVWAADLKLSSAIIRAGGFTEFGKPTKVKVVRDGKAAWFNLKKADKDPAQNPKLLPGDEVEVSE